MHRYQPIQPMDDEAAARPMKDADRLAERWRDLRESVGADRVRAAVDGERWRAAVETGVIERLYEVSPGVTEAIVRGGLEADEALDLDPDVYDQIAAHQHAETVVVDAVRQGRELTTSLIRELHAAVTHAQSHYTAYDQFGRSFRRKLAQGEYKDHDNHVTLPDGSVHEYAPAAQVASEMDRLVAMIAEAADDHPVRLTAFAHHRFTQIHPFADGNGRTARLLANLLLVRGGYLPLIVTRDDRDAYLAALRDADGHRLTSFVDFSVRAQRATLLRIEQVATSAVAELGELSEALADFVERRQGADTQHRNVERDVVEPLLRVVDELLGEAVQRSLQPFRDRRFDVESVIHGGALTTDGGPSEAAVRSGYVPALRGRSGSVGRSFRIGAVAQRRALVGIVALASAQTDGEAVLVLADDEPGPFKSVDAPALLVSAEQPNKQEIRRWIERWLGRMLVDYVQRL